MGQLKPRSDLAETYTAFVGNGIAFLHTLHMVEVAFPKGGESMSREHQNEAAAQAPAAPAIEGESGLLERVEAPRETADITLTSGRHYELRANGSRDELTIRSTEGQIILRIEVNDRGPVLSFQSASVDLVAARSIRLEAEQVAIVAKRDAIIETGGDLQERVGGDHHSRIEGDERLEASRIEVQANEQSVGLRAMQGIKLDGEHIGLNDDPLPAPYAWSKLANDT